VTYLLLVAATNTKLDDLLHAAILVRDGGRCLVCGATYTEGAPLQVDHIKARSRGGDDAPSNLIAMCKPCNLDKAHMSLAIYILHRQEQGLPTEGIAERVAAAIAKPLDWNRAAAALAEIRRQRSEE
jgi:hypothetical protein